MKKPKASMKEVRWVILAWGGRPGLATDNKMFYSISSSATVAEFTPSVWWAMSYEKRADAVNKAGQLRLMGIECIHHEAAAMLTLGGE